MIPPLKNLKVTVPQSEKAKCESCNAVEGAEHPIKGMRIELKTLPDQPNGKRYCQICSILNSNETSKEKEIKLLQLAKKLGF